MGLTPPTTAPTPPSSSLPPFLTPLGENSNQSTTLPTFFPFPPCFFASPLHYQRTGDRLSEMFLLIPISFIITSFHVSGWPGPGGEGSGNYFGVLGINPTRCHWMACLPQWLMNGLLVSHCPHSLLFLFSAERATESICWAAQVWATSQLWGQPVHPGPSPLTRPVRLLVVLS